MEQLISAHFNKSGQLVETTEVYCEMTGHRARYTTTFTDYERGTIRKIESAETPTPSESE